MKITFVLVGVFAAAMLSGCSGDNTTTSSSGGSTGSSTTGSASSSTGGSSGGSTGSASSSTGSSGSASSTGSTGSSASSTGSSGSGSGSTGSSGSTGNPAPPAIGTTEIDRMGRPAINTALTDPFDADSTAQGAVKDRYNADSDPSDWVANWTTPMAGNLAILDALDANCGNQAFAAPALADGGAPADRYAVLASVLADDRLWLNTGSGTCTTYLGVEANATNLIPNSDCGGRTPTEDVIDESYSLLAAGAPSGVTDGVTQSGHPAPSLTAFPFLADPQ